MIEGILCSVFFNTLLTAALLFKLIGIELDVEETRSTVDLIDVHTESLYFKEKCK